MEGINKYLSDIPSEVKFCDQTMDDFNDEAIKFNLDDLLSKHPSVLMETGSPPASLEEKPPTFSPTIWSSPSAALDSISPAFYPVFSTPSTSAQYPLPTPHSYSMGPPLTSKVVRNRIKR